VTIALYLVPSFESLERALSVFAVVLLIAVMDSWDYLKLFNRAAASKTAR
jgi:hypothetical protein